MEIADKIITSAGSVSFLEDGIMRYEIDTMEEISRANVEEYVQTVKQLGGGRAFCNLVVVKNFVQVGDDARAYAASEESNKYTIADAFVIQSFALKLVGNFYIRYNKPVRPTRLFNEETEAINWLRTFL